MKYLNMVGWLLIIVGLLGLASKLLRFIKIPFTFVVSTWYGPILVGAICIFAARRTKLRS